MQPRPKEPPARTGLIPTPHAPDSHPVPGAARGWRGPPFPRPVAAGGRVGAGHRRAGQSSPKPLPCSLHVRAGDGAAGRRGVRRSRISGRRPAFKGHGPSAAQRGHDPMDTGKLGEHGCVCLAERGSARPCLVRRREKRSEKVPAAQNASMCMAARRPLRSMPVCCSPWVGRLAVRQAFIPTCRPSIWVHGQEPSGSPQESTCHHGTAATPTPARTCQRECGVRGDVGGMVKQVVEALSWPLALDQHWDSWGVGGVPSPSSRLHLD